MRVVVLGAGVVGTTTAYALAEDGHEVVVLDRQKGAGEETSFANGGLITPATSDSWAAPGTPTKILKWLGHDDAPMLLRLSAVPGMVRWGMAFLANCRAEPWRSNTEAVLRLALTSVAELQRITAAERLAYDQNPPGLLKLFRSPASMDAALKAAGLFRQIGLKAETLDPAEAVRREPALGPIADQLAGAVFYPDDQSGDAFLFTQALAGAAARRGVEFRFGRTVTRLVRDRDRIVRVETDAGAVTGDVYVLALGSFSAQAGRTAGLRLPVYPAKGYSITLDVGGWNGKPRIPVADDALKAAVTPLGDRLRVAGTVEFTGYDTSLNAERGAMLVSNLRAILPEHPTGAVRHWAGLRPMTPSGRPLVGRTAIANLLVNTGHGPLGWTLAAGSARVIASVLSRT
jgi:D-amino-acid dehydrogenase